jgi:hypothetical protein
VAQACPIVLPSNLTTYFALTASEPVAVNVTPYFGEMLL